MLRRVIVAGLSICVFGLAFGFSQTASAQTAAATGDCFMWIDAATGKRLPTTPVGTPLIDQGGVSGAAHLTGHTTLTNGVNAFRDGDGNWINSATGAYLPTTPVGTPLIDQGGVSGAAHLTGHTTLTNGVNAVRVPCLPTDASTTPQIQTGKDDKVTKTTEEKQPPKTTKKSASRKTTTHHKTAKRGKTRPKVDTTQIHEESRHQP